MKPLKFLIVTESYNENIGGYVVLHKLCDELNKIGRVAYVAPAINTFFITKQNIFMPMMRFLKERYRRCLPFKTNSGFDTPLFNLKDLQGTMNNWVVVYPETISGNPLRAENVVRWFLHHPGFHNEEFYYGVNERYFRYHPGIKVPISLEPLLSSVQLRVVHYPTDLYNSNDASTNRFGTAYCVRKGIGKKIQHDLTNSILIDGMSHKEISQIFKKVSRFISYDPYTAYSSFAVLCGCESVVIPDLGVSIDQWMPAENERAGIAYGFEGLASAILDRGKLIDRINSEISANQTRVKDFTEDVDCYFDSSTVSQ